ncbi:MAG: menaquinol-cytochrome C reductase [Dehalococcoidia bacterium]|nr:menaquinol-cytochrome C reductase [Dehalococcoidia bacterium]
MNTQEFAPQQQDKDYGLVEVMGRSTPMVNKGPEGTLPSWPYLFVWEALLFLGVSAMLLVMSILIDAPLREAANPNLTENPAKAPWYFLNLQELLLHMNPSLAGVIVPTAVLAFLMSIPYLDRNLSDIGIWFASRKGKLITIWSTIYTVPLLVGLILFDQYIRVRSLISEPELIPGWLIPMAVMGLLSAGLYAVVRPFRPNTREVLVAYFTGFVVTFFVLTIASTFFRGLGMNLTLPWNLPPGALSF